jgi:basic membrane lipoprotein Med (substrate-binding protein (PBP1-ABC) superfamily)
MLRKMLFLLATMILTLAIVPTIFAQDYRVCLVTDVGRVNDGTFNQYAYEGMTQAATDFRLENTYIETTANTDYAKNIDTCVGDGYNLIVTVGFLINDATKAAAEANPDVYFIGVDQDNTGGPANFVGVQYREDQAGFLVGVLAALVANENGADKIAGVYGIDVPAVKRFRNGYELGALFVNPDWEVGTNILGNYEDSFIDPAAGASTARQYIGEGAAVIFGAGGPTGSGAIAEAAKAGVYVIGVDQDEYFSTFNSGATEGAEFLISSAVKRVDLGVYNMIKALVDGDMDAFKGGANYVLDVANGGITFAPKHDSDVDDALYAAVGQIEDLMRGMTGVDPASGDLMSAGE